MLLLARLNKQTGFNSICLHHMFARTDNPSDSNISHKYIDGVHETAQDPIQ